MKELMQAMDNLGKCFENLNISVRDGYKGLQEWYTKNFLLVRDVYKSVQYPYVNESQQMNGVFTTTAAFQQVRFEENVDNILFTCSGAILVSLNADGTNAMLFPANTINSLNLRRNMIWIAASGGAVGTCRIWGLF